MECNYSDIAKCNPAKCKGPYKCSAYKDAIKLQHYCSASIAQRNYSNATYNLNKEMTVANRSKDIAEQVRVMSRLIAERKHYEDSIYTAEDKLQTEMQQFACLPSSLERGVVMSNDKFVKMDSYSEVRMCKALLETGLTVTYGVTIKVPGFKGPYIADFKVEYKGMTVYLEVKADYWIRDNQMAKINYLREHGYSIIMLDSNFVDKYFDL